MWGGDDIIEDISDISDEKYLLGLSTFLDNEYFNSNCNDQEDIDFNNKVKFICENNKLWNHIDVSDEAKNYFNMDLTQSVKYSGFLVNHSKKMAIDLADYYDKSKSLKCGIIMAIDPVPVLTETGGGTYFALSPGMTIDTTEDLAGEWCSDLLQIVDVLPINYNLIHCCFAEVRYRSHFCYKEFGVNEDGLLNGNNGKLFEGVMIGIFGGRGKPCYTKVERYDKGLTFKPMSIDTM